MSQDGIEGVDFFTSDLIRRTRARKQRLERQLNQETDEQAGDDAPTDFVFDENLGQIVRKAVPSAASLTKSNESSKSPVKHTSPLKTMENMKVPTVTDSPSIPFMDKSSTESLPVAASPSARTSDSVVDLPRYKVEIPSRFSPVKKTVVRKFSPPVSTANPIPTTTPAVVEKAVVSPAHKSPKPILEKFKAMREEVTAEKQEQSVPSVRPVDQVPVSSIKGRIQKLETIFSQQITEPPAPAPEMLPLKHKKSLFEKKIREETGQKIAGIKRNEYLSQKRGRSESKLPVVVTDGIVAKMQQKILCGQSSDSESPSTPKTDQNEGLKTTSEPKALATTCHALEDLCPADDANPSAEQNEFDKMNEESALAAFFDIEKMESCPVDHEIPPENEDHYFSQHEKSCDADTMSVCTQSSQSDGDFDSLPPSPTKSSSSSNKMYPDLPVERDAIPEKEEFPSSPKKLRFCDEVQHSETVEVTVPQTSHSTPAPGTTPLRTLSMYRLEQRQRLHDPPHASRKVAFESTGRTIPSFRELEGERIAALKRKVYELQNEEVPRCIAITNQSIQALKACLMSDYRDTSSHADAERHVLVSNMKRVAALNEIHALNAQITSPLPKESVAGQLTVQRLDLPIMRDTILAHKKGLSSKSPDSQYYFCVASSGPTVHSTECLSFSDGYSSGFLSFNLHSGFVFSHLRTNFQLRIDVYEVSLVKPAKKESGRTMRLTPKKQTIQSASPMENQDPVAQLKGSVVVNVKNIKKKEFDLQNFRFESSLQGSVRVAITVSPDYKNDYSNFLNFYDEKVDIGTWKRRWCHLKGPIIRFWRQVDDEEAGKKPLGEIDLRHCINPSVTPAPYDVCPRKESFVLVFAGTSTDKTRLRVNWLVNKNYKDVIERNLVAADVVEERDEWISVMNSVLDGMRLWDEEALIPCTPSDFQSYINL